MLTLRQTIEVLQKLGHNPNKSFGQNFLVDKNIVEKSVSLACLSQADNVVEIGPGLGTLTSAILSTGARLTSIERDTHLLPYLRETFAKETATGQFQIINEDATKVNYSTFCTFKIVANLPYAVATALLEKFLLGLPVSMTLMVQRELAERWAASSGKAFSAISIFLQSAYEITGHAGIAHAVGRKCFFPSPAVDSALVHYTLRPNPITFSFTRQRLIRRLFLNRRKQLRKVAESDAASAQWFNRLVDEKKISPTARAEEISPELWQQLAH